MNHLLGYLFLQLRHAIEGRFSNEMEEWKKVARYYDIVMGVTVRNYHNLSSLPPTPPVQPSVVSYVEAKSRHPKSSQQGQGYVSTMLLFCWILIGKC